MALSYAALAVVREAPAASGSAAVALGAYLSRIPALLRRDPNLAWYLVARAFAMVGSMAGGFYTVYALREWSAPASQAGVFTTLLFVGQMAGNAVFGWLADRWGHRLVIMAGVAATLAGSLVALGAPTLAFFGVVFVMLGAQVAAMNVSALNVMLEFAPGLEEQPTYIGLGTTLMAPLAFGAPLAAGLLADGLGFVSVFAASAAAAAIGLALLLTRVRDPRRIAAPRAA
jgi:MFS family permease